MAIPTLRALRDWFGSDLPVVCGTEKNPRQPLNQLGFRNLRPIENKAQPD